METKEIKLPYLLEGCSVLYVDIDDIFMAKAREMAKLSNDQQQPTGVVLVCKGKIIASASNCNPISNPFLIKLHQKFCIRHLLHIPTGEKYWICPGCADKKSHAEYRAVEELLLSGFSGEPVDVYLWGHWWCCDVCWGSMSKLGIKNVYLLKGGEALFNPRNSKNILGRQFTLR